jgi:FAD/FMN-containing dehydrogenase
MSKVAHYLQEHVQGEVMTSGDARRYFSTDASIFQVAPAVVVYPRAESDVRKIARFTWQLAERGRKIPITARGSGTDLSGAAIGSGVLVVFPAHLNRIVEFDGKTGFVTVEPGINFGKLQQTLLTHERFLPPAPASAEYSTIGGAVANNAGGEKSIKYGSMREYVEKLRVVLANGEVIETGRLSKRELSKKLGLSTFEGEIYRTIDGLIEENGKLVDQLDLKTTKNTAGYALHEVKRADGSFDLTPLMTGSQGTLGIVTQITLATEDYNPTTTLLVASFVDLAQACKAITELREQSELPSSLELVDEHLLTTVDALNANQLKGIIEKPFPKVLLLVEYDENERAQKRMSKKAERILEKYDGQVHIEMDPVEQQKFWRVRHSSASIVAHSEAGRRALPVIDDGVVPPEKLQEYLEKVYDLFRRAGLKPALWGHAGDANVHMQPFLDLGQVGDRQKLFKLMDEYYRLVVSLGGATSGQYGDGRLRGPFLPQQYGAEVYQLLAKVKHAFDPHGTLNPGVKIGVRLDDVKPLLRTSYSLDHLYTHLPRS